MKGVLLLDFSQQESFMPSLCSVVAAASVFFKMFLSSHVHIEVPSGAKGVATSPIISTELPPSKTQSTSPCF